VKLITFPAFFTALLFLHGLVRARLKRMSYPPGKKHMKYIIESIFCFVVTSQAWRNLATYRFNVLFLWMTTYLAAVNNHWSTEAIPVMAILSTQHSYAMRLLCHSACCLQCFQLIGAAKNKFNSIDHTSPRFCTNISLVLLYRYSSYLITKINRTPWTIIFL